MIRDVSDAPPTPPPVEETAPNKLSSLIAWFAATLASAAALAWLMGSATPRIRLIAIYPLCLGVAAAYLSMALMIPLKLIITRGLTLWILLIAILMTSASNYQSWRVWKQKLTREHAATQRQIAAILKDVPAEERNKTLRNNARKLLERATFDVYLSERLLAFAQQAGRRQVWDPPVPEIVFGFELFLAALGAYIMVAFGTGSGPWAPGEGDETEEEANE